MLPRERFTALVERDEPGPSLGEAALWIAAEEYPDLDVQAYLAKLDRLAERVRRVQAKLALPLDVALSVTLAEEQGYHGNRDDYQDARNSFLNEVLDRRTGIPITLSLIYIEVARRVGMQAEGIAFPGHFLVLLGEGAEAQVVDPYHGGSRLSADECAQMLERITGNGSAFSPELLRPAPWRKILFRLLANLKNVYLAEPADQRRGLAVIERMLLVQPGAIDEERDRGLLHFQLKNKVASSE